MPLLFLLFLCQGTIAQDKDLNLKSTGIETANEQLSVLSNQINNPVFQIPVVENKGVFIQQIGEANKTFVFTRSENSDIKITQQGNQNKAGLFLNAENIEYNLLQNGDNNNYLHFNIGKPDLIQADVTQNGNELDVVVHGKNSLSERLKINMQGNDKSVIIRNFN